ncbi:hypothetical protein ND748_00940 [Frankia sp. AiPs1]|uniref:hypothetical protein n=1 Tax=Frankia sp. AiPs1 TaxID=573493 RepID=UPI002043037E|nr:hypothetical protein [Frankia sp. AiPs1]MCM3920255.1 hypothetical protein [Frankia sp. AiPs1]
MAQIPLPPPLIGFGPKRLNPEAYMELAVQVLDSVDFETLDDTGRVGFAQAAALVAIGAQLDIHGYPPERPRT